MPHRTPPHPSNSTPGPVREFYLRRDKDAPMDGPYSYYEAETKARIDTKEATRNLNKPIKVELVTVVGTRQGDPAITPKVRVVCMYVAGRKVIGGDLAQFNSDHNKDAGLI